MKDAAAGPGELAVGPGELASDGQLGLPDNHANEAGHDGAAMHLLSRARGLRLGRLLNIQVAVDKTGWLRDGVNIVYRRERGGVIRPMLVRVGREAQDEDVLAHGGIIGRCRRYNDALNRLYQLAARVATMVRERRDTMVPGSAIEYAHHQLSRLDELIAHRQAEYMGYSTVGLDVLAGEIDFFERCDAHLAPIVLAAERSAPPKEERHAPAPARKTRRWLPW